MLPQYSYIFGIATFIAQQLAKIFSLGDPIMSEHLHHMNDLTQHDWANPVLCTEEEAVVATLP